MKKRSTILVVLLILVCLGSFVGYRMLDSMRTDTQPPEITVDDRIPELSVSDGQEQLLEGVTAYDRKDGDVTASMVVESVSLLDSTGRLSVSYAAFDRAGNVAKIQREARYTDYVSPRFTLQKPLLYTYGSSFDVLSTVGATDVIDGDIQHRVRATSLDENSIAMLGTHDIRFQVTNSLGDTVNMVFPVEVYDPTLYDASLNLSEYLVYLPEGGVFTPEKYLESFMLRGKLTELDGKLPGGYSLETTGAVRTGTPGVYTVEYRVTYAERVQTEPVTYREYTGYSKLIVVVEG